MNNILKLLLYCDWLASCLLNWSSPGLGIGDTGLKFRLAKLPIIGVTGQRDIWERLRLSLEVLTKLPLFYEILLLNLASYCEEMFFFWILIKNENWIPIAPHSSWYCKERTFLGYFELRSPQVPVDTACRTTETTAIIFLTFV